jgi:XTP/dITP diphosphohydrolase
MRTIYFITSNKGKVLEAKSKLIKLDIEIIQKNLGYPEIQANTLEEVALFGVNNLRKKFEKPFILEDAGLFIDALDGFPGIYSAYVFYRIGCSGILKIMDEKSDKDRTATFRSVYAYCGSKKEPVLFLGESRGKISMQIQGCYGFGYDPIFIPDGEKKTFGQMETEEKNCHSHRGKSLDKLINYLENHK